MQTLVFYSTLLWLTPHYFIHHGDRRSLAHQRVNWLAFICWLVSWSCLAFADALLSYSVRLFCWWSISCFFSIFLSDEGPMLETLDLHTIRIGSTPTFLYFDIYIYCLVAFESIECFFFIFRPVRSFFR